MIKHNVKCHPLILVAVKLNCLLISLIKVKERDKKRHWTQNAVNYFRLQ